ncbi:hypothetical protein J2X46_001676 [Nocardioides sp. BE266]|uniref:hypothetical protein n=1 Tax=Nocardioides sp. BE266 TaxID=2817725 RepID=UPI00285F51C0|nr:hypothetical protein [Nocardioides sp. BE266]MDR7252700.1 hypothetical protein [Nocardioides sp. BE266]
MTTGKPFTSHVRTSLRRGRGPALAAGAALALSILAPVPAASAADPGSITGVVTDDTDAPLAGIEVTVYDLNPSTGDVVVDTDTTGADGTYLLEGIDADPYYKVGFRDPDGVWATEYYDDSITPVAGAPGAQWVPVTDGGVTEDIDASLEPGAEVSGGVTVGAITPVQDGRVDLWWRYAQASWMRVGSYDIVDGAYSIPGVREASYRLDFTDYGTGATRSVPIAVFSGTDAHIDAHLGGVVANASVPTISGTPQVGQTLTAASGWTPADTTVTYRWVVGDDTSPADDPTGPTYVPTAADLGKAIRVQATGTHGAGWISATAWSAATPAITLAPLPVIANTTLPTVKGKLRVGKVVRVTKGAFTPYPQDLDYVWYANGKVIKNAHRQWFKLTKKQKGKRLTVEVTASAPSYQPVTVRTPRTEKVRR